MTQNAAILLDLRLMEHHTGPNHPERPARLQAIDQALRDSALLQSVLALPTAGPADLRHIHRVHPPEYVERIRASCQAGGGHLDADTPVCPASYDIARLGLGAVLSCCDAVMRGEVKRAFAAVRPPGHHAEPNRAMGFCLFSNIAIAARFLQHEHGVGKIAIVDFDVHHGNGTQACFYDDPSVLFVSLHQHPRTCYPGTGHESQRGEGRGEGFTVNIPLRPHQDDNDYRDALEQIVLPQLDEFRPEVLLLSAGFDAHRDDPLAQMDLSEEFFGEMTRLLVESANQHCGGRIISALEGGYDLHALGQSTLHHLKALNTN